ncbi:hypothetical protein HS041_12010 [Planomonospora sp. ID67723]|uniref:hypothetical protein n=1 Tax=Planomonospora sp. ID67723 TaxID=2738134 RepID=UPI0018C39B5D|nr:hypothetical protein [Planomonospora sp. ID67723]MBG0828492.1 hypothetical protein [Planomonospora sp. ID67723]
MRTTERAKRPNLRLRLRTSEWERHTRARGLVSDAECARLLGLSTSTISRARGHEVEPSHQFIRAAIWHLPGLKFEDLFEIIPSGEKGNG